MAYLKRADNGDVRLVIASTDTELTPMDEVVIAGEGVYRLRSFSENDNRVRFERVDGSSEDTKEYTLNRLEKTFGDSVRITSPRPLSV